MVLIPFISVLYCHYSIVSGYVRYIELESHAILHHGQFTTLAYDCMMGFAEDLIPVILESNHHWWERDLVRLALVSPAWLYHVRRRLYAAPSLHSFAACASLARTLQFSPCLAALVHELALQPSCVGSSHGSPKDRLAVRMLLGLKGLHSLILGGELAIRSERFLGFVSAVDTLERLHVDGRLLKTSLTSRASIEWSEDLTFRFPNLKSLRLTELDIDINPIPIPLSLQWDELILHDARIVSGFLSHLVPEGSTVARLCVKTTDVCEYDEHLQMVLGSSNVYSLKYEVQKANPSDGSFLEPRGLAGPHTLRLRHLELHGFHVDHGILSTVRQRCPEMEELVVSSRSISVSPEDWRTYLTSGALPSLRTLRLTRGTNYPPYQPWSASGVKVLTEVASLRRIDFLPP